MLEIIESNDMEITVRQTSNGREVARYVLMHSTERDESIILRTSGFFVVQPVSTEQLNIRASWPGTQ